VVQVRWRGRQGFPERRMANRAPVTQAVVAGNRVVEPVPGTLAGPMREERAVVAAARPAEATLAQAAMTAAQAQAATGHRAAASSGPR
jgi:hypothetical protein